MIINYNNAFSPWILFLFFIPSFCFFCVCHVCVGRSGGPTLSLSRLCLVCLFPHSFTHAMLLLAQRASVCAACRSIDACLFVASFVRSFVLVVSVIFVCLSVASFFMFSSLLSTLSIVFLFNGCFHSVKINPLARSDIRRARTPRRLAWIDCGERERDRTVSLCSKSVSVSSANTKDV